MSPRAGGTQPPFTAIFTQMWVCLFWIWVKEGGLLKHNFNPQFQYCPISRLQVRSISWGRSMLPLQEGRLCPFLGLLPLTLKSSIIHHYRPVPLLEAIVSLHLHSPWGPQSTKEEEIRPGEAVQGPWLIMPGGHKAKCLGIRPDSPHLPHAADKLILVSSLPPRVKIHLKHKGSV